MEIPFDSKRYENMIYRRCGKSGLLLPAISLGLWHNFGQIDNYNNSKKMIHTAFDHGITHFDLANNYGPPPGSAEKTFGKILKNGLESHRDELVISTKAGYTMWPGPYGDWGSRKYLIASLDQSLQRMQLDYVDIFYHHRPDPNTPLEETMRTLDQIVRQGKALYVGISNYDAKQTQRALSILEELGTPCIIHQTRYNMFDRVIEKNLLQTLDNLKMGCIVFSPLAQGILSDKYLRGIPENSRASREYSFLKKEHITEDQLDKVRELAGMAKRRNQSIPQLAIAWILRHQPIVSVLLGASSDQQIIENVHSLKNLDFADNELNEIENILNG